MNFDCARLAEIVESIPLVQECDQIHSGALRISTPFRYPNGEHVDIFLDGNKELLTDDFSLSDFGQTATYLRNAQVALDSTARRRELVSDILSGSGVRFAGGVFSITPQIGSREGVSQAIFILGQVCVRISDLVTHQRLRSTNPFRDDVEDFLEARGFEVDSNVKVPPAFGKRDITIDFQIKGHGQNAFINVLAAMNDAAAKTAAHEIFIKFSDLLHLGTYRNHKFITVYNSASTAVRTEDIERLKTLSSPISYPQEADTLVSVLRGVE